MLAGEYVELSPKAKKLFDGTQFPLTCVRAAAGAVIKAVAGPTGLLAKHFAAGQAEWPALTKEWIKRKGNSIKFRSSGRTYSAITQNEVGGRVASWGSSADMTAGTLDQIFSSKGLFVKIRRGATSMAKIYIEIGFLGKYRRRSRKTRERDKMRTGSRGHKWELGGTKGFEKSRTTRSGKTFIAIAAPENMAHANILQRGQFLGMKGSRGFVSVDRARETARTAGIKKAYTAELSKAGKDAKAVFGRKIMPLLPAKSGDVNVAAAAFEQGLDAWLKSNGYGR